MIKRKVVNSLIPLPALLFLYEFSSDFAHTGAILAKIVSSLVIVVLLSFSNNLMNALNDIYKTLEISKGKSIKGFIQVFMIALYIVGGEMINGFAKALLIGVVVGTYSSIYVASNTLLALGVTKEDLLPPVEKGEEIDDGPSEADLRKLEEQDRKRAAREQQS